MFKKFFKLEDINKFYTDSLSDLPLLQAAKEGFLVDNKRNLTKSYKM